MRRNIVIGYLVFIHLLLAIVLIKSDLLPRAANRLGLAADVDPEITPFYQTMVKFHERMDPHVPDGAAVFLGDSITQGLSSSAVFSPSVNLGIGGDTTLGVLQRLPRYPSLRRAGIAVIAVGLNDIRIRTDREILHNYSAILQSLPKRLPVVVSAILPVQERIGRKLQGYNARIRALNPGIKTLCETKAPLCTFVEPGKGLLDPSGGLAADCQEGDGQHLNAKGYRLWIQDLKQGIRTARQRLEEVPR